MGNPKVTLEDIMQMGNSELPDSEENVPLILLHLGKYRNLLALEMQKR